MFDIADISRFKYKQARDYKLLLTRNTNSIFLLLSAKITLYCVQCTLLMQFAGCAQMFHCETSGFVLVIRLVI